MYSIVSKQLTNLNITHAAKKLQDQLDDNFVTNLVKINFKYIDKYYLQTQVQAEKSFLLSAISAMIGFAIIVVGIVLMFFDRASSAYVATGAGTISQFISAVFFYLYNRTIMKDK